MGLLVCSSSPLTLSLTPSSDKALVLRLTILSEVSLSAPCPSILSVRTGFGIKTLTIFDAWLSHGPFRWPFTTSTTTATAFVIAAAALGAVAPTAIAPGAVTLAVIALAAVALAGVVLAAVTLADVALAAVTLA